MSLRGPGTHDALLKALRREGAEITLGGTGHLRVRHPTTGLIATIAMTPRNGCRSVLNEVALCRRVGFRLRPQPGKKGKK